MKLTGERPMEGATPDSLLALHDAGYREVVARLGPGIVVDIGCGIGAETERLTAADRLVIGADYSSDTVRLASRTYDTKPGLDFVASDGAVLGLRDRSVDYAVSSHIIEHFVNPALHVIELARAARRRHRVRDHAQRARPTSRTRSTCTCSNPSTSCRCSPCSSTT